MKIWTSNFSTTTLTFSRRPPCASPGLAPRARRSQGAGPLPAGTRPVHLWPVSLRTKILDLRGFDSSIILILRSGILMSMVNFQESLSQRILVWRILVWRLAVLVRVSSDDLMLSLSDTASFQQKHGKMGPAPGSFELFKGALGQG